MDGPNGIGIRTATDRDLDSIVALCAASLGWSPGDPNEELFTWKHLENPFGRSPMWVAEDDDGLAAVRAMLRWELTSSSGRSLRAVRAVDTATSEAHRGQGLFRRLTLGAVDELTTQGVDLVFNTPNDQSRPGYLKMGWEVVGRVPVALAVGSPAGLARLRGARTPARKWSEATRSGNEAGEVLADVTALDDLVASASVRPGLSTRRSAGYLRWRYVDGPVKYRACTLGSDPGEGLAVFRLRRRGGSLEAVVNELILPEGSPASAARRLLWRILREARPDHMIVACPGGAAWRGPAVKVPPLGPILTWRALASPPRPTMDDWHLEMGDVELF